MNWLIFVLVFGSLPVFAESLKRPDIAQTIKMTHPTSGRIMAIAVHPQKSDEIITIDDHGTIDRWDSVSGKVLWSVSPQQDPPKNIYFAAVIAGTRNIFAVCEVFNKRITLYSYDTGKIYKVICIIKFKPPLLRNKFCLKNSYKNMYK